MCYYSETNTCTEDAIRSCFALLPEEDGLVVPPVSHDGRGQTVPDYTAQQITSICGLVSH